MLWSREPYWLKNRLRHFPLILSDTLSTYTRFCMLVQSTAERTAFADAVFLLITENKTPALELGQQGCRKIFQPLINWNTLIEQSMQQKSQYNSPSRAVSTTAPVEQSVQQPLPVEQSAIVFSDHACNNTICIAIIASTFNFKGSKNSCQTHDHIAGMTTIFGQQSTTHTYRVAHKL